MGERNAKLVSMCDSHSSLYGDEIGLCWDGMGFLIIVGMCDCIHIDACLTFRALIAGRAAIQWKVLHSPGRSESMLGARRVMKILYASLKGLLMTGGLGLGTKEEIIPWQEMKQQ